MQLLWALLIALPLCAAAPGLAAGSSISEFIGRTVLDVRGQPLGEVTDVIFDSRDGAVLAITVDYGRWLRVASHEADFGLRQISTAGDKLVLQVPEPALRRMPASRRPAWPAVSAAWLIGRDVRDRLRRDSGEMVDLVVDWAGGRIEQALIELPDEWAIRRRIALPLEAFSLPRDIGQYATLHVRRERLIRLP